MDLFAVLKHKEEPPPGCLVRRPTPTVLIAVPLVLAAIEMLYLGSPALQTTFPIDMTRVLAKDSDYMSILGLIPGIALLSMMTLAWGAWRRYRNDFSYALTGDEFALLLSDSAQVAVPLCQVQTVKLIRGTLVLTLKDGTTVGINMSFQFPGLVLHKRADRESPAPWWSFAMRPASPRRLLKDVRAHVRLHS